LLLIIIKEMSSQKFRDDLVYPELSYQIIGCAFEVFNALGPGHSEKVYQKTLAVSFADKKLKYFEQLKCDILFKEQIVARGYLDFRVEDKIIVELKKDERFSKIHIDQVNQYLKSTALKLAIIINFTKEGVKYKRILNT
jgi:GxxExxY protein